MVKIATKTFLAIAGAAVAAIAIFLSANHKNGEVVQKSVPRVCLLDVCYEVEIAQTDVERVRGLMFRQSLGENEGMLFIFENEAKHSFWMKNTKIALDIVWIGTDGKIVFIAKNVSPCAGDPCPSYAPPSSAKYVLEVAAGQMEKSNARVGDMASVVDLNLDIKYKEW